jgi:hypothetical protein
VEAHNGLDVQYAEGSDASAILPIFPEKAARIREFKNSIESRYVSNRSRHLLSFISLSISGREVDDELLAAQMNARRRRSISAPDHHIEEAKTWVTRKCCAADRALCCSRRSR